jgi:cytochrome c oxidase subunit 3
MATEHSDDSVYFVPHSSVLPIWTAIAIFAMLGGLGMYLNGLKTGSSNPYVMAVGFAMLAVVLFYWFGTVIKENHQGLPNEQVKKSYVWGMLWFIFSEVMFFAAFFGALFYARNFVAPWLGGEGAKGITGEYLWPEFVKAYQENGWPMIQNPNAEKFPGPNESMHSQGISTWGSYLPFWNTVILVTSSFTVHFAHTAIKNAARSTAINWMILTVVLGVLFIGLQGYEYYHAYTELGLTLNSGIYGSTFFILTGFHGFHVTLGTFILFVAMLRMMKGHFTATDQFGLEAGSWYWHFVDVVWIFLFFMVYIY